MNRFHKLWRTTSFRLTLMFMGLFFVYSLFLTLYLGWNAKQSYEEGVRESIFAEATILRDAYRRGQMPLLITLIDRRSSRPNAPLLLLVDKDNQRLTGNIANIPSDLFLNNRRFEFQYQRPDDEYDDEKEKDDKGEREKSKRYRFPPPLSHEFGDLKPWHGKERHHPKDNQMLDQYDNDHIRNATAEILTFPNGAKVLIGRDLRGQDNFFKAVRRAWVVALIMLLLIGALGGYYISRRVLSRVDNISQSAQHIMSGRLEERMQVKGSGDEFDRLSESLNAMLDRLEALMNGMKEVSDNIAHDLKTPLTRMRTRIESALIQQEGDVAAMHTQALERALGDSEGLLKTFNALLHIARLEAGNTKLDFSNIDINAMLSEIAELYEPAAEDANAQLICEIPDKAPCFVRGNRELLAQAFSNLLDNALKYGVASQIEKTALISITAAQNGEFYEISFSDNGIGIAEEDQNRVWDRFVRLEKSRTSQGNGLGLSLVRAIIGIHKGKTRLENNTPGLRVVLSLPIAKSANL